MLYFHVLFGLFIKDLTVELRGREVVGSILLFSVVMLVIFHFGFGERASEEPAIGAGALWVAIFFSSTLGQSRTFLVEREQGCLTALRLTPTDGSAIYLAKLLVNLSFLLLAELVLVPFFLLLYDVPLLHRPGAWIGLLLLCTLGLSVVGTLISSLSLSTRNRELLLPILLLPLLLPVLIGAVEGTVALFPEAPVGALRPWLRLVIGYDIIFLALSMMVFEFVLRE